MLHRIVEAHHVGKFVIHVKFDDGVEGDADLADALTAPTMEQLRDEDVFHAFVLQPDERTLAWGNGLTVGADDIYERTKTGQG